MDTQIFADMAHTRLMSRIEDIAPAKQSFLYYDMPGLLELIANDRLPTLRLEAILLIYKTKCDEGVPMEHNAAKAFKSILMDLYAVAYNDIHKTPVPTTVEGFRPKMTFEAEYRMLADAIFNKIIDALTRLLKAVA